MIRPRFTLATIALVALVAAACKDDPAGPVTAAVDVFTPGNTFSPFTATISVGGVVRFNIFGDEHNVIFSRANPGYPADINVVKDVIVERTFAAVGTFPYACTVHPGMNGEIVVK
ncbi:MAG TPA: hypothetical protein VFO55_03070 [Gemmatimonadaceae bacterium]|nr:hypothetical protein [Gemmatimonadaceae bacterium]